MMEDRKLMREIENFLTEQLSVTRHRISFVHARGQENCERLPRFVDVHAPHKLETIEELAEEIGLFAIAGNKRTLAFLAEDVATVMGAEQNN
jgi:hypothetical protein